MPKAVETKRIEVHLLPDVVKQLKELADKQNRSLKNYCETVLIEHVESVKPTKR